MEQDINTYKTEILISREDIRRRVAALGAAISEDYKGRSLLLIGILNGAAFFLSDLARAITVPMEIDFIKASSYGDEIASKDSVTISNYNMENTVSGKDVILVEDIVDTGKTLTALMKYFKEKNAASIAVCALIDKKERRERDIKIDYVGFEVEEGFLVGYGLDYAKKLRQLPDIFSLFKEDFTFINCGKCNTAFKIKSSIIEEQGTIVRCSVCKHTFKTYKDGSQYECLITELKPAALSDPPVETNFDADILKDGDAQETDSGEDVSKRNTEIEITGNILSELDDLGKEILNEDDDNEEPVSIKQIIAAKDDGMESVEAEIIQEDTTEYTGQDTESSYLMYAEEDKEIKKSGRKMVKLLLFLILALCVVIAFLFFIPEDLIPPMFILNKADVGAKYDPGTNNLSFEEIIGAFVDGPDNSRLFVIRGFVRNNYPAVKHSILLTASILNNRGSTILKLNSYAGIKANDEQLLTMSALERSELIKKGDRETFVEPGSRIPFLMVFDNLPKDVEEFAVEFISASSAS